MREQMEKDLSTMVQSKKVVDGHLVEGASEKDRLEETITGLRSQMKEVQSSVSDIGF
jgi:hypothetical protein